jgi:hypothetical protein
MRPASSYSSRCGVNPVERASLVGRLRKPGMTDDEVDDIVRVVEAYLRGWLYAGRKPASGAIGLAVVNCDQIGSCTCYSLSRWPGV